MFDFWETTPYPIVSLVKCIQNLIKFQIWMQQYQWRPLRMYLSQIVNYGIDMWTPFLLGTVLLLIFIIFLSKVENWHGLECQPCSCILYQTTWVVQRIGRIPFAKVCIWQHWLLIVLSNVDAHSLISLNSWGTVDCHKYGLSFLKLGCYFACSQEK